MSIVRELRTSKEKFYQTVMMTVGALMWLAIGVLVAMSFSDPKLAGIVAVYAGIGINLVGLIEFLTVD